MLQLLGTQDAFAAIAIRKTMRKLTPKLAAHVETSIAPGWRDCVPLHAPLWESWGCSFLWISLLGCILSSPILLSLLSTQSYPCIIPQQWFVKGTVSKKDVLTQAMNILLPFAFPHCFTAKGVSSPGPAPAWCWGTAAVAKLKEKWTIRSVSSGCARMMALQIETQPLLQTARTGTPPGSEQNWCTAGVWIGAHSVDGPSMW